MDATAQPAPLTTADCTLLDFFAVHCIVACWEEVPPELDRPQALAIAATAAYEMAAALLAARPA